MPRPDPKDLKLAENNRVGKAIHPLEPISWRDSFKKIFYLTLPRGGGRKKKNENKSGQNKRKIDWVGRGLEKGHFPSIYIFWSSGLGKYLGREKIL
jgi:hypothetical protein